MSSIFTKIMAGEIPGSFVYEDEVCVALLDLFPFNPGHTLVIPKEEKASIAELPAETLGHMFEVAQKVLLAIKKSEVQSQSFNLFLSDGEVAGQEVPHCHLHIVPRNSGDGIRLISAEGKEQWSRDKLEEMAEKIKSNLR